MPRSCTTARPCSSAGSLAPLLSALVAASLLSGCCFAAPLYVINADTPYAAGLQHGTLARKQIQGWLQTDEVRSLLEFVAAGDGLDALKRLRVDNAGAFPHLAEELTGVAAGANITLEDVWALNLLYELEALKDGTGLQHQQQVERARAVRAEPVGHCTDVYAGGERFAEGHNEDWSVAVKPFWYWLSLNITGSTPCAGLAYPGTLIGYAPTWNAHGMFSTQNSLYPHATSPSGLGCAFAQRAVLCEARSLQEAVQGLTGGLPGTMSSGASINLVDTNSGEMANLELWQADHALVRVGSNYSHTNAYKSREFLGWLDDPHPSSINRQARLDQLPPPQTWSDVAVRLGDMKDPNWPIYRDATLLTVVIDGATKELRAWEDQNPATSEPAKKWNIGTFFRSDAAKLEHQGALGLLSAEGAADAVATA